MKDDHKELISADNAKAINAELQKMIKIPESDLTMRQQQVELASSAECIKFLLSEILQEECYLLERLKHAEIERFSNGTI